VAELRVRSPGGPGVLAWAPVTLVGVWMGLPVGATAAVPARSRYFLMSNDVVRN